MLPPPQKNLVKTLTNRTLICVPNLCQHNGRVSTIHVFINLVKLTKQQKNDKSKDKIQTDLS